jgi:ABC-type nitrate/sulfonate/bicarbonate transport system substrate-binding protein
VSLKINRRAFLAATASLPLLPGLARAAGAPLTMQASWINDAEFSGYFVAIDQGYFTAEGLDLTYLSGGPDVIPESSIIAGRADLTLTTPDTTIKAIAEQGAPFKIIGTQYQKNPIGIVSLAKAPIKSPADMVGKTIAVPPVNTISVEAMLAINGIDKGSVTARGADRGRLPGRGAAAVAHCREERVAAARGARPAGRTGGVAHPRPDRARRPARLRGCAAG